MKSWVPEIYLDEASPPGRSSPTDWLIALPGDGIKAIAGCETCNGVGDPVPLVEGEIIKFAWVEDYGFATFTLHADGTWATSAPMPPDPPGGHTQVMVVGSVGSVSADMDELVSWLTEDDDEPGECTISYYAWSSQPVAFRVQAGNLVPIEPARA